MTEESLKNEIGILFFNLNEALKITRKNLEKISEINLRSSKFNALNHIESQKNDLRSAFESYLVTNQVNWTVYYRDLKNKIERLRWDLENI